jgi:hypothetical protein
MTRTRLTNLPNKTSEFAAAESFLGFLYQLKFLFVNCLVKGKGSPRRTNRYCRYLQIESIESNRIHKVLRLKGLNLSSLASYAVCIHEGKELVMSQKTLGEEAL